MNSINFKPSTVAVLVVSCDNYSDLWDPFFNLFKRFWSDCPFKIYLLNNHKSLDVPGVTTISVGDDVSWSDNLLQGLQQIPEEYILLWIDDLFLLDKVKTDELLNVCSKFAEIGGNQIRLKSTIQPNKPFNELFGLASVGTIYRTSTVMSLWRKEVLKDLLKPGENAWQFETLGTVRSDIYDGFYATWNDCFTIINGVIKGKWQRNAHKTIQSLCPDSNLEHRNLMLAKEEFILKLKVIQHKTFNLLPSSYRRKVKDLIHGGKYVYKVSENSLKNK